MNAILKIAVAAAFAAAIVYVARRLGMNQSGTEDNMSGHDFGDTVPVLHPVEDAEPQIEEPLRDEDLRVAQNAPF